MSSALGVALGTWRERQLGAVLRGGKVPGDLGGRIRPASPQIPQRPGLRRGISVTASSLGQPRLRKLGAGNMHWRETPVTTYNRMSKCRLLNLDNIFVSCLPCLIECLGHRNVPKIFVELTDK